VILLGLRHNGKLPRLPPGELLREIDEIAAILEKCHAAIHKKYKMDDPGCTQVKGPFESFLWVMRDQHQKLAGEVLQVKQHRRPANPIPETDAKVQVIYEPIEEMLPQLEFLAKCTDSLDVAYAQSSVYVMPEKGVVKRVFQPTAETGGGSPPSWDGELLWIPGPRGLCIITPQGDRAGFVGREHGLPPFAGALVVHPVSPGKAVVIGSLEQRTWVARVSRQKDLRFEFTLLHEATKSPVRANEPGDDSPEDLYSPVGWGELRPPWSPGKRLLLVGRSWNPARPLAVDLSTFQVSLFPARWPFTMAKHTRFVDDGSAVGASTPGIVRIFLPDPKADAWKSTSLLQHDYGFPADLSPSASQLHAHEGMLYQPGIEWARVDPRTWKAERVRNTAMPYEDPFDWYAVSAHHGLVGWNWQWQLTNLTARNFPSFEKALHAVSAGPRMYRIVVRPWNPAGGDLALLYPYVPEAVRAKHHRAAQALRGQGASVDTRWGPPPHGGWGRALPEVRSIVYLPQDWKGGDAGLAPLQDLYRLRDLHLIGAPVTNEGLRTIARLEGLETLHLVETKVTDDGLAPLQEMKTLVSLRLEGTEKGREFSNRGLPHIAELSLEKLFLYGDGFTDEGLPMLKKLPLRMFWFFNTRFTKAGLEKAHLSQPALEPELWRRPDSH
jgi:hypothetical protein